MRRILITISVFVIAVFGFAFLFTFTARDRIEDKGRDLLIEKTTSGANQAAELAETAVESDLGRGIVSENFRQRVRAELAAYRADPEGFVRQMTSKEKANGPKVELPAPAEEQELKQSEEKKGLAGFLSRATEKMARVDWKEKIRQHYNESLNALIGELRIFSGSNVMAGLFGLLLAWKSRGADNPRPLIVATVILLISLALSLWLYISDFSVLDVVFKSYLGWFYPLSLFCIFAWLYCRVGIPLSTQQKEEGA